MGKFKKWQSSLPKWTIQILSSTLRVNMVQFAVMKCVAAKKGQGHTEGMLQYNTGLQCNKGHTEWGTCTLKWPAIGHRQCVSLSIPPHCTSCTPTCFDNVGLQSRLNGKVHSTTLDCIFSQFQNNGLV